MSDTTKPPAINRMDPAWAMFAAAYLTQPWDPGMGWSPGASPQMCADFADDMIRERDRRDRDERA